MNTRINKKIVISNQKLNTGFKTATPGFFYNLPGYLAVHREAEADRFIMMNENEQKIIGTATFQRVNRTATSLLTAPFGSIELEYGTSYHLANEFIRQIVHFYRRSQIHMLVVRHYPNIYDPYSSPLAGIVLSHNGFTIPTRDINHHLPVDQRAFPELINKMEKRKLIKYNKTLTYRVAGESEAEKVYNKVFEFRKSKNIPVPVTREKFIESISKNPGRYFMFVAEDENKSIKAVAVMVAVTRNILYYFLPSSGQESNPESPMLCLLEYIYGFAQSNNYSFIDLGVSSIDNTPQNSLIRFKENIGGIPSTKNVFMLKL